MRVSFRLRNPELPPVARTAHFLPLNSKNCLRFPITLSQKLSPVRGQHKADGQYAGSTIPLDLSPFGQSHSRRIFSSPSLTSSRDEESSSGLSAPSGAFLSARGRVSCSWQSDISSEGAVIGEAGSHRRPDLVLTGCKAAFFLDIAKETG
jgi:hypothetical protein